jgi:hypothetical protein
MHLLGRLGRIFTLSVLWLSGCQGDADFSEAGLKPITLNADEYRTEICAIDRLVFEELPLDRERRTALATKLEELAKGIRAKMDSRFLELESLELKRLAQMTKSLAPDAPRTGLQVQWMRIRNNLFDDRAWFARSAADLEPLATLASPSP